MKKELKKDIIDILDNVKYWETCPEDYKLRINEIIKQLRIGGVIERFSIGQPVKWKGMKFWVSEDIGLKKVLVCNSEDTKNIQQPEYNDWWVGRDCLNALQR